MKIMLKCSMLLLGSGILSGWMYGCGSDGTLLPSSTLPVSAPQSSSSVQTEMTTLYFDGNAQSFAIADLAVATALFLNPSASVSEIQATGRDIFGLNLSPSQITGAGPNPISSFDLNRDGIQGDIRDLGVAIAVLLGQATPQGVNQTCVDLLGQSCGVGSDVVLPGISATPFPQLSPTPTPTPVPTIPVSISGNVTNANTGDSLPNTELVLDGNVVAVTDSEGLYRFTALVSPNEFTLNVVPRSETGCASRTIPIPSVSSPQVVNIALNCSQESPLIVLQWGTDPRDLDTHLLGPSGRIAFFSRQQAFGNLDVDDTTSFGPETVRLTLAPSLDGTYLYCVHWFSGSPARLNDLPAQVTFLGRGFGERVFTRRFDGTEIIGTNGVWAVASFSVVGGVISEFNPIDRESDRVSSGNVCTSEFSRL